MSTPGSISSSFSYYQEIKETGSIKLFGSETVQVNIQLTQNLENKYVSEQNRNIKSMPRKNEYN